MNKHKTYFNWSSGKDSALALYYLRQQQQYDVQCLLTSVNKHFHRVSMHGLRRQLLLKQVHEIGLPLETIELPEMPSNEIYEHILRQKVNQLRNDGFQYAAFGDIFLEDLRKYREEQLSPYGINAVFPIWKRDTRELINEFCSLGFKAITICVNSDLLDESYIGRVIDTDFINSLPDSVDPCGENGEFHTFCFDGPIFKNAIDFTVGETVKRSYMSQQSNNFLFCDLLPLQ